MLSKFLIIIGCVILSQILILIFLPPFIIYRVLLVRTKKTKWGRECSWTTDKEQVDMFEIGEKWLENYRKNVSDVQIQSDGFKLVGMYFDFGFDKAAIIIAGRSESCLYSCYFAEPYRKSGFNVLVIDNRCHGFSDGKYNNVGYKEYVDILAWGKFLHDEKNNKSVICHGICIGSATALYALVKPECPVYMIGLVADGMFTTFKESFYNHLVSQHKLKFPTTQIMMILISIHSGHNAFKEGPITCIQNLKKPILFLYSKQDEFSLPKNAEELYAKCMAPNKKLVWFEKGVHSHLRINAIEKYDNSICEWIKETFVALPGQS